MELEKGCSRHPEGLLPIRNIFRSTMRSLARDTLRDYESPGSNYGATSMGPGYRQVTSAKMADPASSLGPLQNGYRKLAGRDYTVTGTQSKCSHVQVAC